jgi:ubiquinone/menaquinone biosynthesis C-methylase UbiE
MPSPTVAAPATHQFVAQDPRAYDRIMGRWSRRLAPLLIGFGGLSEGERVLDVGCGTGSLTFALAAGRASAVTGIDFAEVYVADLLARNTDPRITARQADARSLPFEDGSFDRAYSQLVLQFIPDAERAAAEMVRVVRPGGTVTAAVWDSYSGNPQFRMMWDIAAMLDPAAPEPRALVRPLSAPEEMATLWRRLGLLEVEQTSLLIRMEFDSFDDYWQPFLAGEGPAGQYVAGLAKTSRAKLGELVRLSYLANRPDGPRSFACVAWACRGMVPA